MDPLTVAIVAGLVVSGISGFVGKTIGVRLFKKKVKAHLDKFFYSLEILIVEANQANEFEILIRKSQALVDNRDDFKNQLDDLSSLLNSNIDKLKELLSNKSLSELREMEEEIRHRVGVLYEKWPGKRVEIEVAKDALLRKLGIK